LIDGMNIASLIYSLPAIIVVLTVHEYSHAKVADLLGDPTPRNHGRLTLNPMAHIDPLGLLMLVLIRLGWAKPVPTSPMYYRDRRKGILLVSLAGPLSGILLAFAVSLLLGSRLWAQPRFGWALPVARFLRMVYSYGLIISVFNLIPVYPLDGSRIIQGLLPPHRAYKFLQYQNQIQMIFVLVIFLGNRLLWSILNPVMSLLDFVISSITAIIY
jgi:Zn-dependent protease